MKKHVFAPLPKTPRSRSNPAAGHILQMKPVQEADRRRRQPRDLGAAGRGRIRPADRVRESREPAAGARRDAAPRIRRAHRARRRPRPAAAPVHDRRRAAVDHRRRARPGARAGRRPGDPARLSDQPAAHRAKSTVDPIVLLFTLGVSIAHRPGLRPRAVDAHRASTAWWRRSRKAAREGATGAARHHIRRGLVMAEVALAVMLVIGAGLLLRTVYNLSSVDAGFDRSRLVTFAMSLPAVNYPQAPPRAQLYQRLLGSCASCRACRPPPRCPACRRTGRSTPTTPTSTTTPRRPKGRSRTSTTTRT